MESVRGDPDLEVGHSEDLLSHQTLRVISVFHRALKDDAEAHHIRGGTEETELLGVTHPGGQRALIDVTLDATKRDITGVSQRPIETCSLETNGEEASEELIMVDRLPKEVLKGLTREREVRFIQDIWNTTIRHEVQ